MGTLHTTPSTFVANTRAKSAEVNAKFSSLHGALTDGTKDPYINMTRHARTISVDSTITGTDCWVMPYGILGSAVTLDLATSTARFVALGEFAMLTNSVLHVHSLATFHVL